MTVKDADRPVGWREFFGVYSNVARILDPDAFDVSVGRGYEPAIPHAVRLITTENSSVLTKLEDLQLQLLSTKIGPEEAAYQAHRDALAQYRRNQYQLFDALIPIPELPEHEKGRLIRERLIPDLSSGDVSALEASSHFPRIGNYFLSAFSDTETLRLLSQAVTNTLARASNRQVCQAALDYMISVSSSPKMFFDEQALDAVEKIFLSVGKVSPDNDISLEAAATNALSALLKRQVVLDKAPSRALEELDELVSNSLLAGDFKRHRLAQLLEHLAGFSVLPATGRFDADDTYDATVTFMNGLIARLMNKRYEPFLNSEMIKTFLEATPGLVSNRQKLALPPLFMEVIKSFHPVKLAGSDDGRMFFALGTSGLDSVSELLQQDSVPACVKTRIAYWLEATILSQKGPILDVWSQIVPDSGAAAKSVADTISETEQLLAIWVI